VDCRDGGRRCGVLVVVGAAARLALVACTSRPAVRVARDLETTIERRRLPEAIVGDHGPGPTSRAAPRWIDRRTPPNPASQPASRSGMPLP
jgi:hypothetical protein